METTGRIVDSGLDGAMTVGYGDLRATLVLTQQLDEERRADCVIVATARRQGFIDALHAAKLGVARQEIVSGTGFGKIAIELEPVEIGTVCISQRMAGASDAVVIGLECIDDLIDALIDPNAVPAA